MEVIICDWDENKDFTIEVKGNTKVTKTFSKKEGKTYVKFEKDEYFIPKDGDFIYVNLRWICIFSKIEDGKLYVHCSMNENKDMFFLYMPDMKFEKCSDINQIRPADESQKKRLIDLMEKQGCMWNKGINKVIDIPKKGDLCIFWDDNKKEAFIDILNSSNEELYFTYDSNWINCVKYVSEKQYRKIKSGL